MRAGKHLPRGDAASEMQEDLRLGVILRHLERAGMFVRGVTLDEKRGQRRAHVIRATGDQPAQRHPVDHALELLANSDAPHTMTVSGWRRLGQLSGEWPVETATCRVVRRGLLLEGLAAATPGPWPMYGGNWRTSRSER